MAKMTLNFVSEALYRAIPIDIIIPSDHMVKTDQPMPDISKPYKTVYYLEGLLGNNSGPANYTRLQAFAEDFNVVVVVAGGENTWYTDSPYTGNYFATMIARDLVNFTRSFLNLSHKREDTCLMGFSMGGHGSLTVGLAYPEIFGKLVSIDAAFHQPVWLAAPDVPTWDMATRKMYLTMLGVEKMEDFLGTQHDLDASAEKIAGTDLAPQIMMMCGTKDLSNLPGNQVVYEKLKGLGFDVQWVDIEGGGHSNWTIDHAVEIALEWFNPDNNYRRNIRYGGKDCDLNAGNFSTWKTMYNVAAGDTSEYRFFGIKK